MNLDSIRQILESDYSQSGWRNFLKEIFPTAEIFAIPKKIEAANDGLPSGLQLGRVMLADGKRIAFVEQPEPASTNLVRNRVGVRNRVARLIDQESATGVLAVFTQEGKRNFRFSFVARESALVFSEEGARTVKTETASKRFTYYLGPDEACTTAAQRFDQLARLGATAELVHLIDVFSVEKLNAEFFRDFSRTVGLVSDAIEHKHFEWEEETCRTEAQTLLNRLVFLYFVQRKGWLNGSRSFLIDAFRLHEEKDGATFYRSFLAPLFECLSTEPAFAPAFPHDVPFLNGGLFCDEAGTSDPDIVRRRKLDVPNAVFKSVFSELLERYNFTIVEDSPSSVDVAIDPEMLGQVFEALVLQREESASGGKSRRHDTGSHYTPRPIVHYLCREILAGWLESQAPFQGQPDVRRRIDGLLTLDASEGIDEQSTAKLQTLLTAEEAESLSLQLIRLRMCDPAVGSGAFPLGFLHEMLNLLRLCETRSCGLDPAEGDPTWLYNTKKKIIEQVIYGVDLQPEAIELCKLRLWLSLMVDHELKADPFNCSKAAFKTALRQLEPLPNLDFKIRPANSLLDLIHGQRLRLDAATLPGDSRNHVRGLAEAKHHFYNASKAQDKRNSRRAIHTHYAALVRLALSQERSRYTARVRSLNEAELKQYAAIQGAEKETSLILKLLDDSRREKSSMQDKILQQVEERLVDPKQPTFLWPFDFAEVFFPLDGQPEAPPTLRGNLSLVNAVAGQMELTMGGHLNPHGFDLMVGNPPYIRIQTLKKDDPELADYYKKRFHSASKGNYDLYVCFVERGIELLHEAGQLAYILPHNFFNLEYGEELRALISRGRYLRHIVHFGHNQIFPGASNYVCLLFLAKGGSAKCRFVKPDDFVEWQRTFVGGETNLPTLKLTSAVWNFGAGDTGAVMATIRQGHKTLGQVARIFQGFVTGADKIFAVDLVSAGESDTILVRDSLGKIWEIEKAVTRPFLHDVSLVPFGPAIANRILVFPYLVDPASRKAMLIRDDDFLSKYPLAWGYLNAWKSQLIAREKGKWNHGQWYAFGRSQNLNQMGSPKLIVQVMAQIPRIAGDRSGVSFTGGGNGPYYGVRWSDEFATKSLGFLQGILNSKVSAFMIANTSRPFRGGYWSFGKQFIDPLPIPEASASQVSGIERLVEWLIWLHQQENVRTGKGQDAVQDPLIAAYLEQWVNGLVYELFFPNELHAAHIRLFDLTARLKLPGLESIPEAGRLEMIRGEFRQLYDENGPLRSALFTLGGLAEVRIIEGNE